MTDKEKETTEQPKQTSDKENVAIENNDTPKPTGVDGAAAQKEAAEQEVAAAEATAPDAYVVEQPNQVHEPVKAKPPAWMWALMAVVIVAAIAAIVFIKPQNSEADAIAKVNGKYISKDKLLDALTQQAGPDAVKQIKEQLITEEIVQQEADKKNVKIMKQDIDNEMKELKKSFGTDTEFEQALSQSGMTVDVLEGQMRTHLLLRGIFKSEIKVTEQDEKKYYEENKAQYNQPEQIKASHILVKTQAEADKLLAELKKGADFAKLADANNTDATKGQGGNLDYFSKGKMVKQFEDAALKLNVGETSGVVKTEFGYHIIKVTDKKPAKQFTFEEKKAEIEKLLFDEKLNEKVPDWLEKTKKKAEIENL